MISTPENWKVSVFRVLVVLVLSFLVGGTGFLVSYKVLHPRFVAVQTPANAFGQSDQQLQNAMWEVAKVFGRSSGCSAADPTLGRMVADAALKHQLDPRLVAATVAVESGCNPYAASTKGAIGLMQVQASTWKDNYDFQRKINLLNPRENLETGTDILARYIKKYGKVSGVTRYQGLGTGCPTCDGGYTSKILKLSEEK